MGKISQTVQNILQAPLLQSTNNWFQLKANYHCNTELHPQFERFTMILNFIKLHETNWLAPHYPASQSDAWTQKDQNQLEALITDKLNRSESVNVTALRETYMRRNYEHIVGQVYSQREDTFIVLQQLTTMMIDLQDSLSTFSLLIGLCQGNGMFGTHLAESTCPNLLLPFQLKHFQVESISCLANPQKIIVSFRLHQERQFFSTPVFQKSVIITSTISIVIQLCVYTYWIFRAIRKFRLNRTVAAQIATRKANRKTESRPLLSTGQVALNSVYVPPRTTRT